MRINVDLDGVVYPFWQTLAVYIEERTNGTPRPVPTRWETWMDWGMSKVEWDQWFDAAIWNEVVFREGAPLQGALEVLELLQEEGHFIRLVTDKTRQAYSTTSKARMNTELWLLDHYVPHHALSYVNAVEGKRDYKADIVIDDKPECRDWAQPEALNILFGQPWNEDWVYEANAPVKRVHNGWEGVLSLIKEKAA